MLKQYFSACFRCPKHQRFHFHRAKRVHSQLKKPKEPHAGRLWTCFSGSGLRLNPQYEDNVRPFDTKQDLSPNSQANPLDWWKQYVLVLEVRTSNSLNSCSHSYCEWCDQLFSNTYRPGASCINLAAMFRLSSELVWLNRSGQRITSLTFTIHIRPIFLFITKLKMMTSLELKKNYC